MTNDLTPRQLDVILLRHGETDANSQGIVQGHAPVPLNDRGWDQSRRLARHLRQFRPKIQALIASDLVRAMQTAHPVADALGLPIRPDPAWRERGMGELEGQPADIWQAVTGDGPPPPGAESPVEHRRRVQRAFHALPEQAPGLSTVAVVTHGGVLWNLLDALQRGEIPLDPDHPPLPATQSANCAITHLRGTLHRLGWRWRVMLLNDASFLPTITRCDAG